MVYTFTRALTEQESKMRELNRKVYSEIKKSLEGDSDAKYPYRAFDKDEKC